MAAAAIGFGGRTNADKGMKAIERLVQPRVPQPPRRHHLVRMRCRRTIIERVVDKFIAQLDAQLNEKKVFVQLTPAARRYLAEKGYDPTFGARPMARLIQTDVKRPLADEILFGRLRDGGRVEIDTGPDGARLRLRAAARTAGGAAPGGGSAMRRSECGPRHSSADGALSALWRCSHSISSRVAARSLTR